MRYAQYRRVSSPKQTRGVSLEEQDKTNRTRVGSLGGVIELDYVEPGRSAFTEDLRQRVAFQQMLADAQSRRFDTLIVYDLSRFSRWAAVSLNVAADLERLGITVISATEYFDRTTAAGRMTFTMLAAAAQFKSDHLAERMRSVSLFETSQGRHVGPIPVGFQREGGKLIPTDSIMAVQHAFQLYATRQHSFESVCDILTAEGYRMPSGRPFTKFQVAEMLRNPVYIGRVRCNGQEFQAQHQPVIG